MLSEMRRVLTLIVLWLGLAAGTAAAAPIEQGPVRICRQTAAGVACERVTTAPTSLAGRRVELVREVEIAPEAVRADRPIMVMIVGLTSSEVRWNGVLIGRNGVVGNDRAAEVPGRLHAVFVVPPELVRPGRNVATARLSSHHLLFPVRNPIHAFEIAPYQDPMRLSLVYYLPALLMIGVLAIACVWFGAIAALERNGQSGLLALIAGLAVAQLSVETLRVFVNYPYPWHLARVGAIAGLSLLTAVAGAAWAARRFAPWARWWLPAATALAAAASVAWMPGWDLKAGYALLAGFAAIALAAGLAARRRAPGAWPAVTLGLGGAATVLVQQSQFLDVAYYFIMAAVFAVLLAAQVLALRRARVRSLAETGRADGLERTLARRDAATATIRDGTRVHRVPTASIICLQAADDYCEVRLADGRRLLSTATLTQTLADLPGAFVRVHKSWAVNAAHVTLVGPRPGGRRAVTLSDGTQVPVGRAFAAAAAVLTAAPAVAASGDSPASLAERSSDP